MPFDGVVAKRRVWTGAEVARLRRRLHEGATLVQVAAETGRTYKAARNVLYRLRNRGEMFPDSRLMKLSRVDYGNAPSVVRKVFKRAKEQGYTLDQLAKRSGLAPGTVSNMLQHGNPHLLNFLAVAGAVGLKIVMKTDGEAV